MIDKNGKAIRTGDNVLVTGGYFMTNNGSFRVLHSPGDANWCGSDHCLCRLNKNGTLSTGKYRTAYWPLFVTTNSRDIRLAAKAHNETHAQIEVVNCGL